MHRLSLASCSRTVVRPSLVGHPAKIISRARSTSARSKSSRTSSATREYDVQGQRSARVYDIQKIADTIKGHSPERVQAEIERGLQELNFQDIRRTKMFTEEEVLEFMAEKVGGWKNQPQVQSRLVTYGIPKEQVPLLLSQYARAVQRHRVLVVLGYTDAQKERLAYDLSGKESASLTDAHLSRLFFEWAAHPRQKALLGRFVPATTLEAIEQLFHAADMSMPAAQSTIPRAAPRRKVIMHVGPTNSGKTHNALRALAGAERGVYAGPLRLLAHEIFDRLNNGQIVPLGMEPAADAQPDEDTNLEVGDKSVVIKQGSARFARQCNLVTGEVRKIIDENAGLVSCTVEMVSHSPPKMDVAVIDEIQLIADPERGPAWTAAVLGLNASEIHLCGEERAVPLIEALLKDTQDELIINRYQRLTPLRVAEESLDGDFSRVQRGDCVVTFSRGKIFALKAAIEKATGLRCAVVYGGLPPEIRNKQAAQFNAADSGYDVIIGSDAIGMGLNLKIKRVIFETVAKWTGERNELLSLSSFKQIAGRAGRFGLHDKNEPGVVTTLYKSDLPLVRRALELPIEPLRYATMTPLWDQVAAVMHSLPSGTSLSTLQQVFQYVSKLHPSYEPETPKKKIQQFSYIDNIASELTLADRLMLRNSPINWRDEEVLHAAVHIMEMLRDDFYVNYHQLMALMDFQTHLDEVHALSASKQVYGLSDSHLGRLETMHRLLTLYVWLSFRIPVAFSHRDEAVAKLHEVEEAMQWLLEHMSRKAQAAAPGPGLAHSWQNPRNGFKDVEDERHWEQSSSALSRTQSFGMKRAAAMA